MSKAVGVKRRSAAVRRAMTELAKVRQSLYELERRERARRNAKLVGRCYKHYHSPDQWTYLTVTQLDTDGYPMVWYFSRNCVNDWIVSAGASRHYDFRNHVRISQREFERNWDGVLRSMKGLGDKMLGRQEGEVAR